MTRTPDVVDGTVIASGWGNEIRDRTVQVFATVAERDQWVAPPGSFAIIPGPSANLSALYVRGTDATWTFARPGMAGGLHSASTDANGVTTINHGMGATPSICQYTGANATATQLRHNGRTATTLSVVCYNSAGAPSISAAVSLFWTAWL